MKPIKTKFLSHHEIAEMFDISSTTAFSILKKFNIQNVKGTHKTKKYDIEAFRVVWNVLKKKDELIYEIAKQKLDEYMVAYVQSQRASKIDEILNS
jgi:transposase